MTDLKDFATFEQVMEKKEPTPRDTRVDVVGRIKTKTEGYLIIQNVEDTNNRWQNLKIWIRKVDREGDKFKNIEEGQSCRINFSLAEDIDFDNVVRTVGFLNSLKTINDVKEYVKFENNIEGSNPKNQPFFILTGSLHKPNDESDNFFVVNDFDKWGIYLNLYDRDLFESMQSKLKVGMNINAFGRLRYYMGNGRRVSRMFNAYGLKDNDSPKK